MWIQQFIILYSSDGYLSRLSTTVLAVSVEVSTELTLTTISSEASEMTTIEPEAEVVNGTVVEEEIELTTGKMETGK